MIPAKKFGGKVTQYFIGFGPTVWSKQVGETEYGVKAIPLGGYVKIVGMLPPGAEDLAERGHRRRRAGNQVVKVRKSNTGMFTQLISDARAAEWETISPEDSDRLFYKMAWWKKVIVMAGGPTVNILIAFFIFSGVFATYGNPSDVDPTPAPPWSPTVSECVIPYADQRARLHARPTRSARPPRRACSRGRRDRLLQRRAVTELGPAARADPRQRRRRRRRSSSTRDGTQIDRHHEHHRRGPPDLGDRRDAAPGRLPRRHAHLARSPPAARSTSLDQMGAHDRRDRRGARHPAGQGLGRRQGHRRGRGPRPPTAPSASSAAAGSPARPSREEPSRSPRRPSSC